MWPVVVTTFDQLQELCNGPHPVWLLLVGTLTSKPGEILRIGHGMRLEGVGMPTVACNGVQVYGNGIQLVNFNFQWIRKADLDLYADSGVVLDLRYPVASRGFNVN